MRPECMFIVAGCLTLLLWLFFVALVGPSEMGPDMPVIAAALIYAGMTCQRAQKLLGGLDHQALRALAATTHSASRPDAEGPDQDAQPLSKLSHSQRRFAIRHLRLCMLMTDKKGLWAARLFLAWPLFTLLSLLLTLFLHASNPHVVHTLYPLNFLTTLLGRLGCLLVVISYLGQPTRIAAHEEANAAERGQSLRRAGLIFFCLALALFAYAATALPDMIFSEEPASIYYLAFRTGLPFCAGLWLALNTVRGFRLRQALGHPSYMELRALHKLRKGAPSRQTPDAKNPAPKMEAEERGFPARDVRAATWMMDYKNLAAAVCLLLFLILNLAGISVMEPDNASTLARLLLGCAATLFIAGLVDIL